MNEQRKIKSNVLRKLKLLGLFCSISLVLLAQNRTVTGTVISAEDNEPLIGVTVMVKGGTIGTVTNLDGEFSITLPADNETLVFSMVGMKTLEVNTRNRTSINVLLESDTKVQIGRASCRERV